MGFHDYDLTPFAHVVGLGGDFSTLVQITEGEHAGTISIPMASCSTASPHDDLDGKSADAAIEYLAEIGYLQRVSDQRHSISEQADDVQRGRAGI
ncbi:hypothetical protein [Neorhizobium sp. T25_27]|uniref:hypothetical protein n=1 Tax=Neorhizobium sp. T25_27 TaxID=2093831 RepID=UPI000CF89704|nr:hypothetical protein [Neorhizobium sp. T25_27]